MKYTSTALKEFCDEYDIQRQHAIPQQRRTLQPRLAEGINVVRRRCCICSCSPSSAIDLCARYELWVIGVYHQKDQRLLRMPKSVDSTTRTGTARPGSRATQIA